MLKGSLTGGREIFEDVTLLLRQGVAHREHAFDEAAALGAVGAEAGVAPQDAKPKVSLGRVVRRLDGTVPSRECPQSRLDVEQIAAGGRRLGIGKLLAIPQLKTNLRAQFTDVHLEAGMLQGAVADSIPPGKHLIGVLQQLLTGCGRLATRAAKSSKVRRRWDQHTWRRSTGRCA